jgi:serine/threonine protein kinase
VCKAVLTGLAYIHSQRWAHLDLKPANILIDHYGRPKLADFGFSRLFPGSALTDQHAGSIAFMAPEIFHSRSFDPFKADIWAAAVTFFWISSGETPWTQRQMPEFLNEITLGLVNFPHGFDQSLRSVLYRMTQTDPARRLTAVECLEIEPFASADIKAALLLPPKRKVTAPTLRPSRIAPMNPLTRFTRSASVKRVSDSFKKTDRPISHTFDSDPG